MKKDQLYILMFYALDLIYDETNDIDLGTFLSSANPFAFDDGSSADPHIKEMFMNTDIEDKDYGYESISAFLSSVNPKIDLYFRLISKDRWVEVAEEYLQSSQVNS